MQETLEMQEDPLEEGRAAHFDILSQGALRKGNRGLLDCLSMAVMKF